MNLKYIGKGAFLYGVPARDLSAEDLKALETEWTIESLIASGLYQSDTHVELNEGEAQKIVRHLKKKEGE